MFHTENAGLLSKPAVFAPADVCPPPRRVAGVFRVTPTDYWALYRSAPKTHLDDRLHAGRGALPTKRSDNEGRFTLKLPECRRFSIPTCCLCPRGRMPPPPPPPR